MGYRCVIYEESVPLICGTEYWHWPMHTYTNRTFDLSLGLVELIWLAFGSPQPPTCRGQRIIDFWHNMEAQRIWALTEISCGLLSKRILAELSAFKAVTCPSDIPAESLCCHEYGHEYSVVAFFSSWWSQEESAQPAVLYRRLKEVPYALKCQSFA